MLEGFDMGGFGGAAVCLVGVLPLAAFFCRSGIRRMLSAGWRLGTNR